MKNVIGLFVKDTVIVHTEIHTVCVDGTSDSRLFSLLWGEFCSRNRLLHLACLTKISWIPLIFPPLLSFLILRNVAACDRTTLNAILNRLHLLFELKSSRHCNYPPLQNVDANENHLVAKVSFWTLGAPAFQTGRKYEIKAWGNSNLNKKRRRMPKSIIHVYKACKKYVRRHSWVND